MENKINLKMIIGISSILGVSTSFLINYFKDKEIEKLKTTEFIKNILLSLSSLVIIPSSIRKSFINIYTKENPAIITFVLYITFKKIVIRFIQINSSIIGTNNWKIITDDWNI
jgi:hypothetical protein